MNTSSDQIISKSRSIETLILIDSVDSDELEVLIELILNQAEHGGVIVKGAGTSGVAANRLYNYRQVPAHLHSFSAALYGAAGVIHDGELLIGIFKGGLSNTVKKRADITQARGAQVLAVTSYRNSEL
jgi:D-arabinose 5-phosphate isomerase GutQ